MDDPTPLFRALGDPTRLAIFEMLVGCCGEVAMDENGEVRPAAGSMEGPTVGEVCCRVTGAERVTSTVSFHLKELRQAGLVRVERRGRHQICAVDRAAVAGLAAYLADCDSRCCPDPQSKMNDLTGSIRRTYGRAALRVLEPAPKTEDAGCGCGPTCCAPKAESWTDSGADLETETCCAPSCCGGEAKDPVSRGLYSAIEAGELPETALLASLGCGNPTALADLRPGETVLDLGSGGGIDVLLSARRVGPTGFVYGLDMTDEMLALAERNRIEAGAANVRFLRGRIEAIPLPDASVDVILSNCVVNLSGDKPAVLNEAFRVLKPGGRLAISDVIIEGTLPDAIRRDMEAYFGCVVGALEKGEYLSLLSAAGFQAVEIEATRRYTFADLQRTAASTAVSRLRPEEREALDGRVFGGFVRAVKPS